MSTATFHVVVLIVKIWITIDLLLALALVMAWFYREWTWHRELSEFLEDYWR